MRQQCAERQCAERQCAERQCAERQCADSFFFSFLLISPQVFLPDLNFSSGSRPVERPVYLFCVPYFLFAQLGNGGNEVFPQHRLLRRIQLREFRTLQLGNRVPVSIALQGKSGLELSNEIQDSLSEVKWEIALQGMFGLELFLVLGAFLRFKTRGKACILILCTIFPLCSYSLSPLYF